MPTKFYITDNAQGKDVSAAPISTSIAHLVFTSAGAQTVNVPADSNFVLFSGTTPFLVKYNAAPTWPIATVATGDNGGLNPEVRTLDPTVTSLGITTNAAGLVTVSFYS